ncbi:heterodisulfide reductase subunit A [Desulfacinum hydrothermale DSM 13146]|uniref:Heterodisulfide reductase subunit A n=1 Tax=Desulfacinum hydrothermale DSM 13146 TaxID=1121390 RepID=A0A1W1XK42_9BACT|nr:heterodisulfide reductase subunit A [Desulfacinum hydrothermale DSM 13146]
MNIELLTLTDVEQVEGEIGRFRVKLRQRPRYVNMDRCMACGECARVCPQEVADAFNGGITTRKAIYLRYPQAVPLKYQIDPQRCLKIQSGTCGACEKVCQAQAINWEDRERSWTVDVGSIILAPGFQPFDPRGIRTWGYGIFPNVITSMELECYLSTAGPTQGRLIRPSDGGPVRKIAFVQCVGSRDENNCGHGYCSAVCCMSALKEAMLAKEVGGDVDVAVFFLDMRTPGKDFERYYEKARRRGIRFNRCRVHSLEPVGDCQRLYFRYITNEGRPARETFDLVVLSLGMETNADARGLAERSGLQLNEDGFLDTSSFQPVATERPGIYACGVYTGPKDIPGSVVEASAAAMAAAGHLAEVRNSLVRSVEFPQERDVAHEEARVGVFVCCCGSNIAGVIDVEEVAEYAKHLPHVVHVETSLFACSQDTQEWIRRRIEQLGLNRLVVAACSPRSHEPLFRETLKNAGLNEYLFEMANIRNQASWVHAHAPREATDKAKDLVRMAVAKVVLAEPLPPVQANVNPTVLVIGGGVAGMTAALGMADQGYPVHLVEKSSQLGGNARHLYRTWKGEAIPEFVESLVERVKAHPYISIYLRSQVVKAEGFLGNFRSTIRKGNSPLILDHGVAIVAVGATAYKPQEYGYAESQRVLTALEFDKLHAVGDERVAKGRSFVFIQCVGSREPERPYCSRVCCTHSIQAAIELKEEDPSREITILYRDIRTYGLREKLYKKAREMGVVFINYDMHDKPSVRLGPNELYVQVTDHVLHMPLSIRADVVILATAIVPHPDVKDLAQVYRIPINEDGFFQEAHAKLRPVDFAGEGLFLAGLAHYPKPLDETIAQAMAAVAQATRVLSIRRKDVDAIKAYVVEDKCDGCGLCLDVCPFGAIDWDPKSGGGEGTKLVRINAILCKGCGSCQATCPKDGVRVAGFTYHQLMEQVRSCFAA